MGERITHRGRYYFWGVGVEIIVGGLFMGVVVQKYGGTSVGTIDKMRVIAKKVIERKEKGAGYNGQS